MVLLRVEDLAMGKYIALVSLGLFAVLSAYSAGYEKSKEAMLHKLALNRPASVVALWKTPVAETLAKVYGVSHDELNEPIGIFSARSDR